MELLIICTVICKNSFRDVCRFNFGVCLCGYLQYLTMKQLSLVQANRLMLSACYVFLTSDLLGLLGRGLVQ